MTGQQTGIEDEDRASLESANISNEKGMLGAYTEYGVQEILAIAIRAIAAHDALAADLNMANEALGAARQTLTANGFPDLSFLDDGIQNAINAGKPGERRAENATGTQPPLPEMTEEDLSIMIAEKLALLINSMTLEDKGIMIAQYLRQHAEIRERKT